MHCNIMHTKLQIQKPLLSAVESYGNTRPNCMQSQPVDTSKTDAKGYSSIKRFLTRVKQ